MSNRGKSIAFRCSTGITNPSWGANSNSSTIPGWLILRLSPWETAITLTVPPDADRVPALNSDRPNKERLCPGCTDKSAQLKIAPTSVLATEGSSVAKSNRLGVPTKRLKLLPSKAFKVPPPLKPMPVAVVAVKLPGRFKLASAPKTIPAGFIKNKLGLPPPEI